MENQDRRTFIRTATTLGALGLLTVTGIGCGQQNPASPDYSGVSGKVEVNLNDHPNLRNENSSASIAGTNLGRPLIITHDAAGFHALDSFCTHQGCIVSASSSHLTCPCHGSLFSLTGSVERGPAPTHLKRFPITQDGDVLTVNLG